MRNERIDLRVTGKEKDNVRNLAEAIGLDISSFLRLLVQQYRKKTKQK